MNPPVNERVERSRTRRIKLGTGGEIARSMRAIAPDIERYIEEFAFGDIHSRPGLGMKERELVIMTCLATLGHASMELKSHIHMALNAGWTREETIEIFIQMIVYAGFPVAINALFAAKEVFDQRDKGNSHSIDEKREELANVGNRKKKSSPKTS